MGKEKPFVHPYIPNSAPEIKAHMLEEIGIKEVEEIYKEIPEPLRMKRQLNLPQPFLSEHELKRHVKGLLSKNKSCEDYLSFLGGGCWQHYVPAVCDEIINRSEFLTAYGGTAYSTYGRMQAQFEFQSLMGELVGMDVVTDDGRPLGRVETILPTGSNDVYLVQGSGREWLIPATEEVIVRVDRGKGQMVIHAIEGLLEE